MAHLINSRSIASSTHNFKFPKLRINRLYKIIQHDRTIYKNVKPKSKNQISIYQIIHQQSQNQQDEDEDPRRCFKTRRALHMNPDAMNMKIQATMAYLRPMLTNMLTKRLAKTTPQKFAEMADQKGISRMEAMMAPVHAPVPGNGTATNSIRPNHWNSSTGPAFCFAFLNKRSRN